MIKINLLPVRTNQRDDVLKIQGAVAAVVLLLTIGICFWMLSGINGQIDGTTAQIAQTRQSIEDLKRIIGEIDQIKNLKADLENKLKVIEDLEKGRLDTVVMMESVALAVPETLWLNSLTFKGTGVQISGYAIDNQMIAEFIQALQRNPQISGVVLSETVRTAQGGFDVVSFNMQFTIAPKRDPNKG